MFSNIGNKIKTLAVVMCVIMMVGSIIGGFIMIATHEDLIALGFVTIIVGCLFAWVGSFFMYGFGELIDTNQRLANVLSPNPQTPPPAPNYTQNYAPNYTQNYAPNYTPNYTQNYAPNYTAPTEPVPADNNAYYQNNNQQS